MRSAALVALTLVALYGWLLARGEGAAFLEALGRVRPALWGGVVVLSCFSYLARFVRWQQFLLRLGHAVPAAASLRIYLAGFALTLTPGKAGETIRSLYLRPFGVPFAESLAAFICERLLDLLIVALVACLSLRAFPEHAQLGCVAVGVCLVLAWIFRSGLLPGLARRFSGGVFGGHIGLAAVPMGRLLAFRCVIPAMLPTLLAWSAQGLSLFLVVGALGHQVDPVGVVGIYCVAILAGAVSFLPGGLGATEAALVILLSALGIPAADAVVAALLTRGLTLWLAVLVGFGATTSLALAARRSN